MGPARPDAFRFPIQPMETGMEQTQPSTITLRAAEPGDEGVIHRFVRDLAEYERLLDEVVSSEADIRKALFGENAPAEALLAFEDGEPAGFALYYTMFSTFSGKRGIYLEDLYVRPQSRGRGAGKALMARLAGIALERGCVQIKWAVLDWNEPSIQFYKNLGAAHESNWLTYRWGESEMRGWLNGGNSAQKPR